MQSTFCSRLLNLVVLGLLLTACQPTPTVVPTSVPTATLEPSPIPPTTTPPPVSTPTPTPTPSQSLVSVEKLTGFASAALNNRRDVWVFLPGEYAAHPERSYPVLYANDGQDMTAVSMERTLNELYAAKRIEPVIVVAVFATGDRLHEYGTAGIPDSEGRGSRADRYTAFMLDELLPHIQSTYRVDPDPARTAIMGWSLGGLSAFDLAWHYPQHFGMVGVFSGSFWWRTASGSLEERQASRVAHQMVRQGGEKKPLRFWFEVGTRDEDADRDGNGVIDAIQDTTELMDALRLAGYADETDMVYVQVEGGRHNQSTWGQALPDFLLWAFGK